MAGWPLKSLKWTKSLTWKILRHSRLLPPDKDAELAELML